MNLKKLQKSLKEKVVGQDDACDKLLTALFKYCLKLVGKSCGWTRDSKSSLLLIGPSGTGKTYMVKEAAKLMNLGLLEINAKSISQEGWTGTSFINLVKDAQHDYWKEHMTTFKGGIIFLDEVDKILFKNIAAGGDDVNYHIQTTLLKYIEGFGSDIFENSIFIFAGAFVGLHDAEGTLIGFDNKPSNPMTIHKKVINYGMIPELLGRLQEIIELRDLDEQDYKHLIKNKYFILNDWQDIFKQMFLTFEPDISILIKHAKDTELGVRGLIQAVEIEATKLINNNLDIMNLENLTIYRNI